MKSVIEPAGDSIRVAALMLAASVAGFAVHALDPPHLEQFPPVAPVLADNQGSDRFETLARQQAALTQLAVHDDSSALLAVRLDGQPVARTRLARARRRWRFEIGQCGRCSYHVARVERPKSGG